MDTKITKEFVEGGVNITTTTVEFIPNDVIKSRASLLDEQINDLQTQKVELDTDKTNLIEPAPLANT